VVDLGHGASLHLQASNNVLLVTSSAREHLEGDMSLRDLWPCSVDLGHSALSHEASIMYVSA